MSVLKNKRCTVDHCRGCGREKSTGGFGKNRAASDGLKYLCLVCDRARQTAYRTPEKNRQHTLRRCHGMELGKYADMFVRQKSVCAICHEPETKMQDGAVQSLAVDHDHETGRVRGLLCNRCNRALGLFADKAAVLEAALEYLRK